MDEVKQDLAEMKSTQHEMMKEMREGMQRMTIAVESLQKSANSNSTDIAGWNPKTKKSLSSVERFNLLNQTWTQLPRLKITGAGSAAVIFKNQEFVCGGITDDGTLPDSIEVLDLNGYPPEWHEFFVNLPIKVSDHKCVVYRNRLLIIGGCMKLGENLDTIDIRASPCSSVYIQVALSHEAETSMPWSGVVR
jgi:N-acetylneuraminic acid mutarotase